MTDAHGLPAETKGSVKPLLVAQSLSLQWGERLDDFELPCPLCPGELEFQGVHPDDLYEFAEGEPGVLQPLPVFLMSFICNRCGHTVEFDSELFNPAYLAQLQGADQEYIDELSVRDFRILVPMNGDERSDTLLHLATALAGQQQGEVTVLDITPYDQLDAVLDQKLQRYQPRSGDPAPVRMIREAFDNLDDELVEVAEEQHSRLIMIDSRCWAPAGGKGTGRVATEVVLSRAPCDVSVVYDRGLKSVRRILLVTSGGPHTKVAVLPALQLARSFEAQLDILYVASPRDTNVDEMGRRQIANTLKNIVVPDDVRVQQRVVIGQDVAATIVAESAAYDLLILGASPGSWRPKGRLESLSAKIARNSSATSLIIRARRSRIETLFRRLFGLH